MIQTDQGEFGVMLDGPLLFVMEGGGAHEIRLSRGSPLNSHEANTALRNGKKLRRARVILARGEESWRAEVDAADFAFRGLKLPKVFQYDAASLFQDRMLSIRTYVSVFLSLYDRFIEERMQVERWESVCRDMQSWVAGRAGSR